MKNFEQILAALTRKCPTCGSASGKPCKTKRGKNTYPHVARMRG